MSFRVYSDRHYVVDVSALELLLPSVASVSEALYRVIVLTLLHLESQNCMQLYTLLVFLSAIGIYCTQKSQNCIKLYTILVFLSAIGLRSLQI